MTADFFENQSRAMRKTGLLTFLFFLATFMIIVSVYFAVMAFILTQFGQYDSAAPLLPQLFRPKLFAVVAGSVLMIVLGGTIFKILELRQGGSVVAELLGGTLVPLETRDPDERKLLNVVEEMSIASGCAPPAVYTLRGETSINAFAAGFSQNDAAIGVTRGAIRQLTRDQLQGVVAHEFSHIVNGDMRLNIKLMGTIHGILQLGVLGGGLVRASFYSGESHRHRSRDDRGGAVPILVLGLILLVLGYIGVFFGKLIKAAVSRQREYLADASAIQYTRNPEGIAGALVKIGGLDTHSRIRNRHAEEASHFFFGDAMEGSLLNFGGLLSTHPPLTQRIRAILPTFDGDYPSITSDRGAQEPLAPESVGPLEGNANLVDEPPPVSAPRSPLMPGMGPVFPPGHPMEKLPAVSTAMAVGAIGQLEEKNIEFAQQLIASIPERSRLRVRRAGGAQATVIAILLRENEEGKIGEVWRLVPKELQLETRNTLDDLLELDPRTRLPLIDLALPAIKQLPEADRAEFLKLARALIVADRQTTLLEYTIEKILEKHLDSELRLRARKPPRYQTVASVLRPLQTMLSALSHCGTRDSEKASEAFAAAVESIGPAGKNLKLLGTEVCGLDPIRKAFDDLQQAAPAVKKEIVTACATVVSVDGHITPGEADLLRAVCESLDCPMPPLLVA